jgi:hypothetical protein
VVVAQVDILVLVVLAVMVIQVRAAMVQEAVAVADLVQTTKVVAVEA